MASRELAPSPISAAKQLRLWIILILSTIVVTLVGLELMVRVLSPQAYLYPRYQHSERLSLTLLPSTEIVAALPGAWRFVYTTSEYGFRAPTMAVSNRYDRPNIVILGDSYSFGQGVNDGEEYPALLRKLLGDRANIINLGVPGYGLTQQIRLFYEFGNAYDPSIVVIQFCSNDPDDNLFYRVTEIEDGRFVFKKDRSFGSFSGRIKDFLSDSIIQRSQLYNFLRQTAYQTLRGWHVEQEVAADDDTGGKERLYNKLLGLFVRDLHRRGIDVVFFGVTDSLEQFPHIAAEVAALSDEGLLSYLPSEPWFEGISDYGSPEGHGWGAKGHRVVAEHIAPPIEALLAARGPNDRPQRLASDNPNNL